LKEKEREREQERQIGIIVYIHGYIYCDDRITGIFPFLRTVYCGDHKKEECSCF